MNSGATCHLSCNRELLDDFYASHVENVAVANGGMVVASGEDSVVIYPVNNLISVKRLAERGIKVILSHN